jgi:hypothetical protein
MKAVFNAVLVGCEVCDLLNNVLEFCEGHCNNEITESIEVIHFHCKLELKLQNTHKIISKVNIKLKLILAMEKDRQNAIHQGRNLCSRNNWMVITLN